MYIVLTGTVFTRRHSNPNRHNGANAEVIIKHVEGDVIGYEEMDGGVTRHPDCWNITMSKVEVLVMQRE